MLRPILPPAGFSALSLWSLQGTHMRRSPRQTLLSIRTKKCKIRPLQRPANIPRFTLPSALYANSMWPCPRSWMRISNPPVGIMFSPRAAAHLHALRRAARSANSCRSCVATASVRFASATGLRATTPHACALPPPWRSIELASSHS